MWRQLHHSKNSPPSHHRLPPAQTSPVPSNYDMTIRKCDMLRRRLDGQYSGDASSRGIRGGACRVRKKCDGRFMSRRKNEVKL